MYQALKNAALCAAVIAFVAPAQAAIQLRISDGTPAGTVLVTDQGVDDSNPTLGVVTYSGLINGQWLVNFSTGSTKPALGTAASPDIDLHSVNLSSASGGSLTIELTETDYTGSGPGTASIGGLTVGTVALKTFVDYGNAPFGKSTLIANQGPFTGPSFGQNASSLVVAAAPYSITFELRVTHTGFGNTGIDAEFSVIPPSVTCPTNTTVRCGSSLNPDVNPALGKPAYTGSSNCLPASITYTDVITTNGPCSKTVLRTWTISDACGVTNYCTQQITVAEDVLPVLNVPANTTVECNAVPPVGIATGTDNCDPNVVVMYLGEVRQNGANPACSYTLVRTWKATDSCGNAVTNRQNIVVRDTTAPVLTVPPPETIQCGTTLPGGTPTATDNCDTTPTITFLGMTTNGSGCSYTITRRWKAADDCGNATTNSQVITVVDTTPPVITFVPTGGEIGCVPAPSIQTIRAQVTATDNCQAVTINITQMDGGTDCSSNRTFRITATDGCNTSAVRTVTYTMNCAPCVPATFEFDGSSSLYGSAGNVRTFTVNGVSVKATAFSRIRSSGAWNTAYLGQYSGGLGVTDGSEGRGGSNSHTVDNLGRDNYVLFEFSKPVVLNRATLGYVVTDSDLSVWIGTFADPFNNHLALNDTVLDGFSFYEENLTTLSTPRTADLNAGEMAGNAIIIAAQVTDTTPDDQFKIRALDLCVRTCEPPCAATICGSVLRDCDANGSLSGEDGLGGWTVTLKNAAGSTTLATTTTDAGGGYCFTNLANGTYTIVVTPKADYAQTYDADGSLDHRTSVTIANCVNKTGVKFGYTGTDAGVSIVVKGPSTAKCGDTITYSICVTNTGNTCLYGGLRVDSPLLGGQIFYQTPVTPGEGFCFTKTYVVKDTDAGTLVNNVTAIGDPPGSLANVTRTVSVSTAVTCTPSACVPATINFEGSSALYGTAGNVRTFIVSGVSVKATAFSRIRSSGVWNTAYLGQYSGGLGVTDGSEGNGDNDRHTVSNLGRDNCVLFEFSKPVVLDRAILGYVVGDSDLSVWIGTFNDPYNNHLNLSDAVLGNFGYYEEDLTTLTTARTADLNEGEVVGNAIIIAAQATDTTPEDRFKIKALDVCVRSGPSVCAATLCGSVLRDCDADGSLSGEDGLGGWTVTLKNAAGTTTLKTLTTDASGSFCFTNLTNATYTVVVTPQANYSQTYDADGTKDHRTSVTIANCADKSGVKFGYTGTAPAVHLVVKGPATAKCGDTITYTFYATNTGNTCVYGGLRVNSPLLGGEIFHETPVSPGEGFVFTKTYVVKTSDAGTLVNTATVIGDPPGALATVTKSVSVSTTVTCTTPCPPTSCLTTKPGNNLVSLFWYKCDGATSYNIKRCSTKDGTYATIKTGATSTNWTDSTAANGTLYYYKVAGVKSSVEGILCDPVSAFPCTLASPWNGKDIGATAETGGSSLAGGTFTIIGSGEDIWNTGDEFHFAYQSGYGDCTVVARVNVVGNTDQWAKAGVMIRESLASGSRHAFMCLTPGNGAAFQSRSATGGSSLNVNTTGITAPYWVKITRVGSVIRGYISPNGYSWTQIGEQKIYMSSSVYIGLAVTSHNDGELCTATFQNVTATP